MSSEVHSWPSTGDLAAYVVGRPVSAEHFLRMCWDISFALGFNTQTICAQRFAMRATTTRTIRVSYTRNPGVDILLVEVEAQKGNAVGANGTLAVTSSAGTIAWLGTDRNPLSSGASGTFLAHAEDNLVRQRVRGFMDVTGLTVGTTYELLFAFTNVADHNGIAKLTVIEVPIATVDTVRHTAEIGIEAASFYSGNPIATNLTTSPRGMARFLAQIDKARKDNKRQWQVMTSELDADAFTTTSAAYATLMAGHSARNPTWRWRAQRHYTTAGNETMVLGFRYRVTGGATAALQMLVDGVATAITGLTSATYAEATTALLIPCNGADDQEVTLQVEGKTSGGILYCDRVRMLGNQP